MWCTTLAVTLYLLGFANAYLDQESMFGQDEPVLTILASAIWPVIVLVTLWQTFVRR